MPQCPHVSMFPCSMSQVAKLEGELGKSRARAQAVEHVIVDSDVLAGLQGRELDQQIQAAWSTAQSFKQRWLECKGALDSVKSERRPDRWLEIRVQ